VILFADTDAVAKLAAWELFDGACELLDVVASEVCLLPAAAYQFGKNRGNRYSDRYGEDGRLRALRAFENGRTDYPLNEADNDLLIDVAQRTGFAVDGGERVLIAATLHHDGTILTTGEKRALRALHAEPECADICQRLSGRVLHVEQVVLRLFDVIGFEEVRARIVPVRQCDAAIRAAFGSGLASSRGETEGYLTSTIEELRLATGDLLVRW